MRRLSQLSLLTLCLYTPLSAQEYAQPHWQNPNYIEQSFIDITFGREYAQRTQKLNKWVKEINVRILDSTADMALHQQLIHHQLRHLSQLSGQKFNYDKLMHADLVIQVLSEADYLTKLNKDGTAHLLKQSICLAQVEINQFDEIESNDLDSRGAGSCTWQVTIMYCRRNSPSAWVNE
jgi:hypothetical protein